MSHTRLPHGSRTWFLITALFLAWVIQATAILLKPESRDVPLDRLIKNIEKLVPPIVARPLSMVPHDYLEPLQG